MGYMRQYKLQLEDWNLVNDLLAQHIRAVNNAIDSGDDLLEPRLAEIRDHAVRTKLGILYICETMEEEISKREGEDDD